jgi:hypothetical protein
MRIYTVVRNLMKGMMLWDSLPGYHSGPSRFPQGPTGTSLKDSQNLGWTAEQCAPMGFYRPALRIHALGLTPDAREDEDGRLAYTGYEN